MNDAVPATMTSEMHEIQPLMHLLSTYVIKPIAFDANPYVLPRAAQFVKYGGANKYFQKHGNKPGMPESGPGNFQQQQDGQFRKPYTQQKSEAAETVTGDAHGFDDFETVDVKPKKPFKQPYKKLAGSIDEQPMTAPGQQPPTTVQDATQVSMAAATAAPHRKSSDAAPMTAP